MEELLTILDDENADRPGITPAPQRDYRPLLWIAARDTTTVAYAAQAGVNFVVGQLEDGDKQSEYVTCYRSSGGEGEVRGVRMVHVAESEAQAWTNVATAVHRMYASRRTAGYGPLAVAEGRVAADSDEPEAMLKGTNMIAGTPERVARELGEYVRRAGVDRVDVMMHLPDVPRDAVRCSMRLFAEEVMTQLGPEAGGSCA